MKQYLIFIALILIVDLYAFQSIKSAYKNNIHKNLIQSIYFGFTAFSILFFVCSSIFDFRHHGTILTKYMFGLIVTMFVVKLVLILFLLVEDLFRLGKLGVSKVQGNPGNISRSEFFNKIAVGVGGLPFVAFLYGMAKSAYNYQIHRIQIPIADLPNDLQGFKIVQLSDIHSGSFTRTQPIEEAVQTINGLKPDLFVFTGDLVNDFAHEVEPYIPIFQKIEARLGKYSVTGNHDYADYVQWTNKEDKRANFEQLKENHAKIGWRLLMNESVPIQVGNANLDLIGVENWGHNLHFKKYGNLKKAMENTREDSTKVLLSHDPSHWDGEVNIKYPQINLMLSGHTHGFQFGVETKYFKFSPSQWVYKQWAGLHQKAQQFLYVNRGFGFIAFPGRVGILPEITVLELVKA